VDRIVAPGSGEFHAAGDIARELGETAPVGPPPPPLVQAETANATAPPPRVKPEAAAAAPAPAIVEPAEEAARQDRAERAIAAMKLELAELGAGPATRKGSGWLMPVVLVAGLIVAMLIGLNILKKISGQATRAHAGAPAGVPEAEGTADDNGFAGAASRPELPTVAPPAASVPPPPASALGAGEASEANELVRAQNWVGLVAFAKRWTQAQPDRAESWRYLGMAYARSGDFNAAADALPQALARDPANLEMRSQLADVYMQGNRYAEAIALYEQISAATPNDARMWNNYGIALMGAGQSAQGIAALETSVRIDPSFKSAWTNLGNAYRAAGDSARASAAFANAR
jgi:Flp pilus assembly protein TadD